MVFPIFIKGKQKYAYLHPKLNILVVHRNLFGEFQSMIFFIWGKGKYVSFLQVSSCLNQTDEHSQPLII